MLGVYEQGLTMLELRVILSFRACYCLVFLPIHFPAVLAFISNYILLNIVHVWVKDKNYYYSIKEIPCYFRCTWNYTLCCYPVK